MSDESRVSRVNKVPTFKAGNYIIQWLGVPGWWDIYEHNDLVMGDLKMHIYPDQLDDLLALLTEAKKHIEKGKE